MHVRPIGVPSNSDALADPGDWVFTVVSSSQRFVCDVVAGCTARGIDAFVDHLPEPPTPAHDLLLRSILARIALGYRQSVHPGAGNRRKRQRGVDDVLRSLLCGTGDPRCAFKAWAHRALRRDWSSAVETIAADWLAQASIPISHLSRSAGGSERWIRAAFSRTFGIHPRAYRRRVRVLQAIEALRASDLKNEAVARELGFLSPKNLYRALRLETGLTPRQVRALSAMDASALVERLSRELPAVQTAEPGGNGSTTS